MHWWSPAPTPPDPWRDFHRRCVDSNGREREAALRDLPGLPAELYGRALPLVLARLNDWVPQVRAAALRALPLLLREELQPAWIDALPGVVRLMGGDRWAQDGVAAREAIQHFLLQSSQRRAALLACSPQLALPVQRWLAVQSWHYGSQGEQRQALCQALQGADARLAGQALRRLQVQSDDWPNLDGIREALARAHFPGLRLAALRHGQARGRLPQQEEAVELAFGRHGATREWLLFHADAALKEKLRERAEGLLDAGGPVFGQIAALQVLCALKAGSLPARVGVAFTHPVARLREVGYVLGLPGVDESQAVALTCRALADPSPRVQRAALTALAHGRVSMTAAELIELSRREARAVVPVLNALAHFDSFTRAAATLSVLAEQPIESRVAAEHLRALERALARRLYALTDQQAAALQHATSSMQQRRPELTFIVT
jgi:hypothetical protein